MSPDYDKKRVWLVILVFVCMWSLWGTIGAFYYVVTGDRWLFNTLWGPAIPILAAIGGYSIRVLGEPARQSEELSAGTTHTHCQPVHQRPLERSPGHRAGGGESTLAVDGIPEDQQFRVGSAIIVAVPPEPIQRCTGADDEGDSSYAPHERRVA